MTKDLYQTLGIKRDAPLATIKSAYYRQSKKHHPDKGGDPKAFERIVRAKTILLDKDKRAKYDATGEMDDVPDNSAGLVLQAVMQAVQRVAGGLAQQGRDPESEDLVGLTRRQILQDIETVKKQIELVPENVKKARALAARFGTDPDKPNHLSAMFESQARDMEQQTDKAQRQIHVYTEAEKLLASYTFEKKMREPKVNVWFIPGV